jgi:hypothetical protein
MLGCWRAGALVRRLSAVCWGRTCFTRCTRRGADLAVFRAVPVETALLVGRDGGAGPGAALLLTGLEYRTVGCAGTLVLVRTNL